jgi:eukaryotic-like serine/threonine-protein kinase
MKLGLCEPSPAALQPGRASHRDHELHRGDVLDGRFAILDVLCQGGMATIYKGRDLENAQALVAIKVPHPRVEMDPSLFSRFQREAGIGSKLNHPCVLKFIPAPEVQSRPYIVTEFLEGTTLYQWLNERRPLPESEALALASRICDALQYLHEHNVNHRDVKPENVMICADGSIRLMDFGIAWGSDSRRLTFVGFAPGTPHYMAPERVKGKRGDARTDIYSLGALLYEMLTGVIAFNNQDTAIIMDARVRSDPAAPRKLNPNISPQAEEIVLRAMDRSPANRYQTAAAMKADLDAPERVHVTGRCQRLKVETVLTRRLRKIGYVLLWCGVPVAAQVILFLLIWKHLAK